jgi:peroxiredoxin family protein
MKNIALETVEQLRELCVEADVTLNACQMSVDVFRFDLRHLTADVSDHAAATSFLLVAWKSDV